MPKLKRAPLADYIAKQTMNIVDRKELAQRVAALLLHENHTDQLSSLMRDVLAIRARSGLVEAVAVSAHELSPAVITDIENLIKSEYPQATSVSVSTRIEPQLIGGVRIELPDEQLDLSIRRKLATFRHLTDAIKE